MSARVAGGFEVVGEPFGEVLAGVTVFAAIRNVGQLIRILAEVVQLFGRTLAEAAAENKKV